MPEVKKVVRSVLLPSLQLSLGLFLIMKTTPLWAVIHCSIAYLLDFCRFPYTDYKKLRGFKGRVFKKVISHTTTAGDVSKVKKLKDPNRPRNLAEMIAESDIGRSVSVNYLDQRFVLERVGNKMQVKIILKPKDGGNISMKDGPAYYITDKMWEILKYIEKAPAETMFVKNQKEIWEEVVTGDIMEFKEVLDSVILDNRAVVRLDYDYFLPVNLLLAEDKLRSTLNFVGVFLQTQKQIHWVIPACLSITAAVMGFSTTLRLKIAGWIGKIICRGVQLLCDLLPYATRRSVYSWGSWVERFKPSNDFHSKIIKGNVWVLVAGGAKFDSKSTIERIIPADCLEDDICSVGGPYLLKCNPNCDSNCDANCNSKCDSNCDSNCDSVYIEWIFDNTKCSLKVGRVALKESRPPLKADETSIVCGDGDRSKKKVIKFFTSNDTHSVPVNINYSTGKETGKESLMADDIHTASVDIDCSAEEAKKLFIFASCIAELKSGSLKSYDSNSGTVYVRHFIESINAYVRSGYPPLHRLYLENVVVR